MNSANIRKWFLCFVETDNDDGSVSLSVIPWRIWLLYVWNKRIVRNPEFSDFEVRRVRPWKIKITH